MRSRTRNLSIDGLLTVFVISVVVSLSLVVLSAGPEKVPMWWATISAVVGLVSILIFRMLSRKAGTRISEPNHV